MLLSKVKGCRAGHVRDPAVANYAYSTSCHKDALDVTVCCCWRDCPDKDDIPTIYFVCILPVRTIQFHNFRAARAVGFCMLRQVAAASHSKVCWVNFDNWTNSNFLGLCSCSIVCSMSQSRTHTEPLQQPLPEVLSYLQTLRTEAYNYALDVVLSHGNTEAASSSRLIAAAHACAVKHRDYYSTGSHVYSLQKALEVSK